MDLSVEEQAQIKADLEMAEKQAKDWLSYLVVVAVVVVVVVVVVDNIHINTNTQTLYIKTLIRPSLFRA